MKKYNSNFFGIKTVGSGTVGGDLCSIVSINYTLYDDKKEEKCVYVRLPYDNFYGAVRPERSNKIVEDSLEFFNGYKVVGTANGEYAYVRQEDGKLLPARFDIAGDFNEYGLAMVGRNGKVSWINKKMEYLSTEGKFVAIDLKNNHEKFNGWSTVTQFSKSNASLSRLYNGEDGDTSYLTTDGKIKEFFQLYGNEKLSEYSRTSFSSGKDFNEQGYAFTADNVVLLATGYCLSLKDMLEIAEQNGWLKELMDTTAKLKQKKAPDNKEGN
jgi:hypothetical protein